jgi:DNA-binding NarL/FixJ family response regulator
LNPGTDTTLVKVGATMTVALVCDDDHPVARERLTRVLRNVDGIRRTESVATDELVSRYSHQPSDMVFVGVPQATRAGVDAARMLTAAHPHADVIMFGSPEDTAGIAAAIAAGAAGFLRWDHPGVARAVTTTVNADTSGHTSDVLLTERELHILTRMSQGTTNSGIARELFLSEDTIKAHAKLMFRKLGVHDRAAAVLQGFRHRLVH